MIKILGIDNGTNSHGWAVVGKTADNYILLDKGVNIFQEGVKLDKGIESSKAAERTEHRATRVRYYRRKLRKIRLLRILTRVRDKDCVKNRVKRAKIVRFTLC